MEFFRGVYEDPTKFTVAILTLSAITSFLLMRHYQKMCDPIRDELKNALLTHNQQPSVLNSFLMSIDKEKSEKYYNMKVHLLKHDGAPTNVCVNQLLKVCSIEHTPVNFNRCHRLINRIRFYHKVKTAWCSVETYSKENQEHEKMLMRLWTTLKPDEPLDNRMSKKWIDIGFQGQDPATDFRGSGLLGLKQLLKLCTNSKSKDMALKMYGESVVQEQWFFFAVTGINITQKLLNSLNNSKD